MLSHAHSYEENILISSEIYLLKIENQRHLRM